MIMRFGEKHNITVCISALRLLLEIILSILLLPHANLGGDIQTENNFVTSLKYNSKETECTLC